MSFMSQIRFGGQINGHWKAIAQAFPVFLNHILFVVRNSKRISSRTLWGPNNLVSNIQVFTELKQ